MNEEDKIGLGLACVSIFLAILVTWMLTKSLGITIGVMAIVASAIGGAYFAAIGYVKRIKS